MLKRTFGGWVWRYRTIVQISSKCYEFGSTLHRKVIFKINVVYLSEKQKTLSLNCGIQVRELKYTYSLKWNICKRKTQETNFERNKVCFSTTIFQRLVLVVLRWRSQALLTCSNSHVGRKETRKLHTVCVATGKSKDKQTDTHKTMEYTWTYKIK